MAVSATTLCSGMKGGALRQFFGNNVAANAADADHRRPFSRFLVSNGFNDFSTVREGFIYLPIGRPVFST